MKYVDASALLRILFTEPGSSVPLTTGERLVSSELVEVETFRAVDRERLLGNLDDTQTAVKRKELTDLLAMLDLAAIDTTVVERRQPHSRADSRSGVSGVSRRDTTLDARENARVPHLHPSTAASRRELVRCPPNHHAL